MKRRYQNRIKVPRPIYSNKHVLVMELLKGDKLVRALKVTRYIYIEREERDHIVCTICMSNVLVSDGWPPGGGKGSIPLTTTPPFTTTTTTTTTTTRLGAVMITNSIIWTS